MILTICLIVLFILTAAICKAVQDKIQFHYAKSIFQKRNPRFWNPNISWKNKWKNGEPEFGEAFWGSSTIFVSFTDAWHLFGMIKHLAWISAIMIHEPIMNIWILDFFNIWIFHNMMFELFFSRVFAK
jgi:hypothetical protein